MAAFRNTLAGWFPFSLDAPSPLEAEVTALFDELRVPLQRYVLSLGLPAHDGDDIVQEVFLALFRHLSAGKPRDNLRGWIFRVGYNLALKRRTANGRTEDAGGLEQWQHPDPNPEELTARKLARARLWAVVKALPERDRCCLWLRAEGLRYREIAEALDISLGSVAMSLSRTLAKLSEVEER